MLSYAQRVSAQAGGKIKRIAIASDHRGVALKKELVRFLKNHNYRVKDFGPSSDVSCDYPLFGAKVASAVSRGDYQRGVLICNSGIGMSMVSNKFRRVRAALCKDMKIAKFSRLHNDANVLVLAAASTPVAKAKKILGVWLATGFEGGRHARRVEQIHVLERKLFKC